MPVIRKQMRFQGTLKRLVLRSFRLATVMTPSSVISIPCENKLGSLGERENSSDEEDIPVDELRKRLKARRARLDIGEVAEGASHVDEVRVSESDVTPPEADRTKGENVRKLLEAVIGLL